MSSAANSIVRLKPHTDNLPRVCAFCTRLLGSRAETIDVGTLSHLTLGLGDEIEGGVVECDTDRPVWLRYIKVTDVYEVTGEARVLGASLSLTPREGPTGWRSVIETPAGPEIGWWQPQCRPRR